MPEQCQHHLHQLRPHEQFPDLCVMCSACGQAFDLNKLIKMADGRMWDLVQATAGSLTAGPPLQTYIGADKSLVDIVWQGLTLPDLEDNDEDRDEPWGRRHGHAA